MADIYKNYRKDHNFKVEKTRLLSDNYNAYILYKDRTIDLSEFGLKSIKWEANDELIIRKPCTMKETLPIVRRGGFNFDFTWEKNCPDLMSFLLDQSIAYLDGYDVVNDVVVIRDVNYGKMGQTLRTGLKYRSKVTNSDVNSVFTRTTNKMPTTYITAKFDLRIDVQQFTSKKESYIFKNGVFLSPSQSTEENSSPITESMKGYFPTVETNGSLVYDANIKSLLQNAIYDIMSRSIKEENLPDKDRVIINPDNKSLLSK